MQRLLAQRLVGIPRYLRTHPGTFCCTSCCIFCCRPRARGHFCEQAPQRATFPGLCRGQGGWGVGAAQACLWGCGVPVQGHGV